MVHLDLLLFLEDFLNGQALKVDKSSSNGFPEVIDAAQIRFFVSRVASQGFERSFVETLRGFHHDHHGTRTGDEWKGVLRFYERGKEREN